VQIDILQTVDVAPGLPQLCFGALLRPMTLFWRGTTMAMAIDQTEDGLTYGLFGLGIHGTGPGSVAQQVHDGDTVNVRAIGNLSVRFLGIDTPEVSFKLPGNRQFTSIKDPPWDAFLTDPFAPGLPPLNLDVALRADLLTRLGEGAAKNHADHAEAAHRALERAIEDDRNARGLTREDFQFFAAFASEIADRYGRLLAFLNVNDLSAARPSDYNTRMLELGLATPYFIWPNVDPWRSRGSLTDAALPPAQFRQQANGAGKLRNVRNAVAQARARRVGIFDAYAPLRIHAFELRFLAQRRAPDRWVIDLESDAPTLLKPQNYHTVSTLENRLFVPADYVPLFERAGWQRQP
jgi:endonuclease YncB( thermonuclease family)